MKPSLQLQIGQHLTMTPQLQQAIRLLQLSALELQAEIQEALEANPLLEEGDNGEVSDSTPIDYTAAESALAANQDAQADILQPIDIQHNEAMPDELPVDSAWEDIFANASANTGTGAPDDDDYSADGNTSSPETLAEHLAWQLNLTPFSDTDRAIGLALLDAIDTRGYLTASLDDILAAVLPENDPYAIEIDEVEAVLHRIQQFDPPGVGARDLRECLLIQLRQMPEDTPRRTDAMNIVQNHLEMLASRDFSGLMRQLRLNESGLKAAITLIKGLNPHPGGIMDTVSDTEYVIPEVIVRRHQNRWLVELNPDALPKLRINTHYASLVRQTETSADGQYLRNHLQEARWLIKSLQSRSDTLLKVASRIVEHQRAFLEKGPEAMKPLVLREIAEEIDMHESTVSRVTTQKYMLTPRGLFELRYFFSSHVGTSEGGEASSTAIRAMIRKLVNEENPRKPLSDNKIADLLQEQGIEVARRTIAKYRESLNIPPSHERKQL